MSILQNYNPETVKQASLMRLVYTSPKQCHNLKMKTSCHLLLLTSNDREKYSRVSPALLNLTLRLLLCSTTRERKKEQ